MSGTGSLNDAGSAEANGMRVVGSSASTPEMIQPPEQSAKFIRVDEKKKFAIQEGKRPVERCRRTRQSEACLDGRRVVQPDVRPVPGPGQDGAPVAGRLPRTGSGRPRTPGAIPRCRSNTSSPIPLRPRREVARKRAPQHQVGNLVAPPALVGWRHYPPSGRVSSGPSGLPSDSWTANRISKTAITARELTSSGAM
jgi:hypothetical protein